MSGTIYLIVEGKTDGVVVAAILRKRYPQVKVYPLKPTGNKPSVSRLSKQVDRLIKEALSLKKPNDCVVVLHDADFLARPYNRDDYEHIEKTCKRYRITHILAKDELESWLLADAKLCLWLNVTARNWDEQRKPSEELNRLLDKAGKPKYREETVSRILEHLDGTGDQHSPSLKLALEHLINAPCTKP